MSIAFKLFITFSVVISFIVIYRIFVGKKNTSQCLKTPTRKQEELVRSSFKEAIKLLGRENFGKLLIERIFEKVPNFDKIINKNNQFLIDPNGIVNGLEIMISVKVSSEFIKERYNQNSENSDFSFLSECVIYVLRSKFGSNFPSQHEEAWINVMKNVFND